MINRIASQLLVVFLVVGLAGCAADETPPAGERQDSGAVVCRLCELDASAPDHDGTPPPDARSAPDTTQLDGAAPAVDGAAPAVDGSAPPYVHEDVTPAQVAAWLAQGTPLTLVDVREPSEYADGHIDGAINLPLNSGVLQQQYKTIPAQLPVVVYCRSGARSDNAATFLAKDGYEPVYDLGGILGWTGAGYPVVK